MLEEVAPFRFENTSVGMDADFTRVVKPERQISLSVQSISGLNAATAASDMYTKTFRYCILDAAPQKFYGY